MESLEKKGEVVTKTKFAKIWNLLKLSKRLLLKMSLAKNQRVGANQSRSKRSSFAHMTCQNRGTHARMT